MMAGDGVSTYLALIFGTLLSSQGTDASFVLTLSGFPPGSFPSVLRFRLYQILSGLIPCRRGLSTFTTLTDSPGKLIIEFRESEFRHAGTPNSTPPRGDRR